VWLIESAELISRLRSSPFVIYIIILKGGHKILINNDWRLHLEIGENQLSYLRDPTVLFDFTLGDANNQNVYLYRVAGMFCYAVSCII
jgi:hypothetical protein